ncbi:MAG: ATP-grasp domain-containing protein [Deltaproteobacteria bacterium]|nr:MAG: ATP-grasp domain-containing protein [Deltaproteobacteria bacterium]
MPEFTRGLAAAGARVFGIGDTPRHMLAPRVKEALYDYLQVPRILDEDDVLERAHAWLRGRNIDRVESQWEPTVILAARMRERFGLPGMSVDTVLGFRDKQLMKDRIAAAGLRVPYAYKCRTEAAMREAAEKIGFPLIVKPIAGAGSADTYRVDDAAMFDKVIRAVKRVEVVSVEEFVDGEEFTYDTVCVDGAPIYENVAQYLPRPLIARSIESIDPIICTVRDLTQPKLQDGLSLGRGVLGALGMGTGFTHMEWYRKADGEVVFGEIGCRPGGARLVDQMNYTSDQDLFLGWAQAVLGHRPRLAQPRKYNAAIVFKRAKGQGRITRIEGLDAFKARYHDRICAIDLLPVGTHRRDWTQTLISDGWLIVRHPDWNEAIATAEAAAKDIRIWAQ